MKQTQFTRRAALQIGSSAVATGYWINTGAAAETRSANDKLNFAHIGVGGRGGACFAAAHGHNVVALCDIDETTLGQRAERLDNKPALFFDYRQMYEKMSKQIDAVVVATPDHHHALASLMAIRRGMHVYTEKPLAHTVHECFLLGTEAEKHGVKTQMGNCAHQDYQFRRAAELIRSGIIGDVTEVHVNRLTPSEAKFPAGLTTELGPPKPPLDRPPIPRGFHWDEWLGGAALRPYHPAYCPKSWRVWRDFGTGGLGDFFCHHADPAFSCLDLTHPISVEAAGHSKPWPADRCPGCTVRYVFPARGPQPPVTLYWHSGGSGPPANIIDIDHNDRIFRKCHCLMIGDKGAMAVGRGNGQVDPVMLPRAKFKDVKLPPTTLGPVVHHMQELTHCVVNGGLPSSNFQHSASQLTAAALLGHVAFWAGGKIEWDGPGMRVTNLPDANRWIRKEYRTGWEVA
jgi:predicted dehydrogenase